MTRLRIQYLFALSALVWTRVFGRASIPPCSLNGELNSEDICICEKPWTGPDCGILRSVPLRFPQGYGMVPNLTTWGADIFIQPGSVDNGSRTKYHMFVSAITGGCSLRSWQTRSRIEHAISDSLTGPYYFSDIAIPEFAHNPKIIQVEDGNFALIHIGPGLPSGKSNEACSTQADYDSALLSLRHVRQLFLSKREQVFGSGSTIHVAPSLDGPWTPLLNNTLGHCNNPAPFVKTDQGVEYIYIVCNDWILMRSNRISGPWTKISKISILNEHDNSPAIHYEDPSLYIDERGFHIIYHVYNTEENPPHGHDCSNSTVSAHVFSSDGLRWFKSQGQPYGTQIQVSELGNLTVATRERPSLVFQKDLSGKAIMTHLVNGVCSARNCPNGPSPGCVDCKYDSWDYTLVQPLDVQYAY